MSAATDHSAETPAERAAFEAAMATAVGELEAKIATCHERVPCPTCRAPIGFRCRRMPPRKGYGNVGPMLKHPHAERQTADGIYPR